MLTLIKMMNVAFHFVVEWPHLLRKPLRNKHSGPIFGGKIIPHLVAMLRQLWPAGQTTVSRLKLLKKDTNTKSEMPKAKMERGVLNVFSFFWKLFLACLSTSIEIPIRIYFPIFIDRMVIFLSLN